MKKNTGGSTAGFRLRRVALGAMLAMPGGASMSAVTTGGSFFTYPDVVVIGPGDTQSFGSALGVGNGGVGTLTVDGGSFLGLARISFGSGGTGNGSGLISGPGTRVELGADGFNHVQRLVIGDWGTGQLTVNNGAWLDTRDGLVACLLPFRPCDSFVGGAAGDNAVLNIDGAGTRVDIGANLFVAQPGIAVQHLDGWTYGVPGGTTRGTVNVTAGAVLSTDRAQVGPRHWSTNATGRERNIAEVNISGIGSRWEVVGGRVVNNVSGAVTEGGASFSTALDRNAWASINVTGGGVIDVQGQSGVTNFINLTGGGGRTDALVSGAASRINMSGDATVMQIGRSLGSARLELQDGGGVRGVWYTSVGRDGSFGELVINGAGSRYVSDATASAAANGTASVATFDIGRNGTGVVTVSNAGRLEILATEARSNSPQLSLGRDAASSGTLNIRGAGSVVQMTAQSVLAGGGAAEAFNPFVRVGRDGNGTLNITAGGKLLLEGNAVSTLAHSRGTSLYIGGTSDTVNGGKGIALVSGAGSEIRMTGSDTYIGVGHGPQSFGQLTVNNRAEVSANGMNVGRSGGVGVLQVDNATLSFSGQQTGGVGSGAFLSIGRSGGIGVATITNASVVTLHNMGSAGASLNLGGTGPGPFGDGSLTLSGGSRIDIQAAPGLAALTVARDGSALMRVRGASTVNVGDGSVSVGRLKGSDGTLLISENSSLTAGWVGVGRNKTATGDEDGGTATVVLINSTLTAPQIVIGSNGFLGGNGTIVGNVTNHGIFSPGTSPGTMTILGDYVAGAGSRLILEVESDGNGGFLTDKVIFGAGSVISLGSLAVEFRFLGATNPDSFQAGGGFQLATFVGQQDGAGQVVALAPAAFAGVSFNASADGYNFQNFSFSAVSGATFTATPVPEPAHWALLLAGLGVVVARSRASVRRA